MGALDVSSVRAKTMEEKEAPSLAQQQKHHEEEEASKQAAPKKKICCACPETKRLRDECIVQHGEAACSKWIQAHLECLRAEGFKGQHFLTCRDWKGLTDRIESASTSFLAPNKEAKKSELFWEN